MPGVILETSGVVLASGGSRDEHGAPVPAEALFRFDFTDAFPDGREMTARSVLIDAEAQQRLLGDVRINTPAEIVRFLELLEHPAVARRWERCLEADSVEELRRVSFGDAGVLARLLLGPPPGGEGGS